MSYLVVAFVRYFFQVAGIFELDFCIFSMTKYRVSMNEEGREDTFEEKEDTR